MPTINLTTPGAQNWVVPSDCRMMDGVACYGAGANGIAGIGNVGGSPYAGDGGPGGGGGAYSGSNNIAVTPGASLPCYVGVPGASTYWWSGTVLAACGSGQTGGQAGNCTGQDRRTGANGAAGTAANGIGGIAGGPLGGTGGTGGAGAASGAGGGGGAGNAGTGGGNGDPGGPGTAWGGGGGGGGGGIYSGGAGGAGGAGYQGLIVLSYTPYVLQPPTVGSLSKQTGKSAGGETITVTGTNFDKGISAVRFGAVNAASFTAGTATSCTCVTPAQPPGTVTNVIVVTGDGTSTANSGNQFTFLSAASGGNMPMLGI